jgi:hypothetical protein
MTVAARSLGTALSQELCDQPTPARAAVEVFDDPVYYSGGQSGSSRVPMSR